MAVFGDVPSPLIPATAGIWGRTHMEAVADRSLSIIVPETAQPLFGTGESRRARWLPDPGSPLRCGRDDDGEGVREPNRRSVPQPPSGPRIRSGARVCSRGRTAPSTQASCPGLDPGPSPAARQVLVVAVSRDAPSPLIPATAEIQGRTALPCRTAAGPRIKSGARVCLGGEAVPRTKVSCPGLDPGPSPAARQALGVAVSTDARPPLTPATAGLQGRTAPPCRTAAGPRVEPGARVSSRGKAGPSTQASCPGPDPGPGAAVRRVMAGAGVNVSIQLGSTRGNSLRGSSFRRGPAGRTFPVPAPSPARSGGVGRGTCGGRGRSPAAPIAISRS